MSDRRGRHTAILPPRPSVENSRNRRQQHITPVEVRRPLIEVREPEQERRYYQSRAPSHSPLEQILHPASKEEFLGHGSKEKYRNPAQERAASRQVAMRMDKPQRQSQHQHQRREEQ